MKPITIIHTADIHLDAPFTGARQAGYAHQRREDLKRTFAAIIDLVLSEHAQALLIAGDLFEHDMVSRQTMDFVVRQMNRIAPIPVLMIAGNHDPLITNSWYSRIDWPPHVYLLSEEKPVVVLDQLALQVSGFGFNGYNRGQFDHQSIPVPTVGYLNLLLIHGTLDMAFTGEKYQPIQSSDLANNGYQLVSFGHFHKPFLKGADPILLNPGSPEPLGFDEEGDHGVYLCKWTEQGQNEIRFVPLALRNYRNIVLDVTALSDENAVKMAIQSALSSYSLEKDYIRIRLTGRFNQMPDMRLYEQVLLENWFMVRIDDKTLPDFDLQSIQTEQGLRGEFARILNDRIHEAHENKDHVLEDDLTYALLMGLEALETGTVPVLSEGGVAE